MKLSPDAIRTLLTSVFPSDFIDDRTRECGVVERDRDIDIRMFVWTLAVGFAVGGEPALSPTTVARTTPLPTSPSCCVE
jgi:hypothetical protein